MLCSVEGCERKARSRGLCSRHYQRQRKHGDATFVRSHGGPCSVDGCEKPLVARGLCQTHYSRWSRWGDPLFTKHIYGDDHLRFWSKVDKGGSSEFPGCWEWTANLWPDGYGMFGVWDGVEQHSHRAPRYIWVVENGPIPDDLLVCHTCDNPLCVRMDHLFLGTNQENMQDCSRKHRITHGEQHPSAKLTWQQVEEIRERHRADAASYKQMAREYGVNPSTISRVVKGLTWTHPPVITDLNTQPDYHPGREHGGQR